MESGKRISPGRLFDRGLLFRLSPHYMEIFTVIFLIAKVGDDNNSCKDK